MRNPRRVSEPDTHEQLVREISEEAGVPVGPTEDWLMGRDLPDGGWLISEVAGELRADVEELIDLAMEVDCG